MRYFTDDSGHVVRVHIIATARLGEDFIEAKGETYDFAQEEWVESPGITVEIMYSGDWRPCGEQFVTDCIGSLSSNR